MAWFPRPALAALASRLRHTAPNQPSALPLLQETVRRHLLRHQEDLLKESGKTPREAAVLIPLCTNERIPSVLFTKRTDLVSTHKGQVSFPGGHVEADESYERCALRETYEELGISPEHITTLGFCETIPAVTGTMVTPVIGLLKPDLTDVPLTLSEDEVETVFTLPIRALLSDALLEMRKYENRGTLPVFHGADHEVWGLTAMILHGFVENCLKERLHDDFRVRSEANAYVSVQGSLDNS
uniref:Nudix hydrolase domain-containing protein n=1 Tax=Pinguiococcus pyrenoidosus TaxID=172671 RepID=A0A7R9U5Y6_9STRA|mmetsp:Transcript_16171/g.61652  ORF Transcript_16171/g.61652 Transcript_16171/m.61652 type:complete len:241 (+) Transcript_16171:137-859(+)